ncbi:MAG: cysteine rich repeat-containing protein [Hyphomicrobiaceae bacterium]
MANVRRYAIKTVAALTLCFAAVGSAHAQDKNLRADVLAAAEAAFELAKASCDGDISTYCPQVTPGNGRVAMCLMAHEDKISSKCFWTMLEVAQGFAGAESNLENAAEICKSDIKEHCGSVEPGEGRIAQCIDENESKLTPDCAAELTSFRNRLKK